MADPIQYNPFPNASFGTGSPAEDAGRAPNFLDAMASGIGRLIYNGFMAPGQALNSQTPITTDQMIAPAANMAGLVTLGAGAVPAEANTLRAGMAGRALPADNYLGPISKYTDTLYREMHPSEALMDLPTSVVQGGFGPGGVQRKFYADQPDLALGQGSNKGVKVEYDAAPFEGVVNRQKPAWDLAFQNGNAEYLAAPRRDANIRDAVRSFEVDPSSLSRVERAQYQRVISNLEEKGWDIKRTADKIIASKPSS